MKKIKNLGIILSRSELKHLVGGTGTCSAYFPSGTQYNIDASFTAEYTHHNTTGVTFYGVSYNEAKALSQDVEGAHWCCTSCNNATWYNPDPPQP